MMDVLEAMGVLDATDVVEVKGVLDTTDVLSGGRVLVGDIVLGEPAVVAVTSNGVTAAGPAVDVGASDGVVGAERLSDVVVVV